MLACQSKLVSSMLLIKLISDGNFRGGIEMLVVVGCLVVITHRSVKNTPPLPQEFYSEFWRWPNAAAVRAANLCKASRRRKHEAQCSSIFSSRSLVRPLARTHTQISLNFCQRNNNTIVRSFVRSFFGSFAHSLATTMSLRMLRGIHTLASTLRAEFFPDISCTSH